MQHLDEGTIHAWLDGALTTSEAAAVEQHAAGCATCARAVAEARGIIAGAARIVSALDDVPSGVIPSGGRAVTPAVGTSLWHRLRLTPGRAALAATILLAVSATLTLRSSSSPAGRADTSLKTEVAKPVPTTAVGVPTVRPFFDSVRTPGASSQLVNAVVPRKAVVVRAVPETQKVAEQRTVADAVAPRDTTTRVLAKAAVGGTMQEPASGASAPAPPAAPAAAAARNTFGATRMLEQRLADSSSAFEGCYRVSADSTSGSTEMIARGLPATFALSRPSAGLRSMARRADTRAEARDANAPVVVTAWRQLSTTEASVTFDAGGARPVSLTLTAGSQVGVASSGDRTSTVRVVRASCPP